jgi:hypothetical protein
VNECVRRKRLNNRHVPAAETDAAIEALWTAALDAFKAYVENENQRMHEDGTTSG